MTAATSIVEKDSRQGAGSTETGTAADVGGETIDIRKAAFSRSGCSSRIRVSLIRAPRQPSILLIIAPSFRHSTGITIEQLSSWAVEERRV